MDILKIASLLDTSGHFSLSDKLYKIAQSSQRQISDANRPYDYYPTNKNDIGALRSMLVPTDFRQEIRDYHNRNNKGVQILDSNSPDNFVFNLFRYALRYKFSNLKLAFDNYANIGATLNGTSIKMIPELQKLYVMISNSPAQLTEQIVKNALRNIVNNPGEILNEPGVDDGSGVVEENPSDF